MLQLCNVQKWGKTIKPFWLFQFQNAGIAIHEEMFVDKTQAFFDKFSQMIPFYLWCHFLMWYYFAWWSLGFQFATMAFPTVWQNVCLYNSKTIKEVLSFAAHNQHDCCFGVICSFNNPILNKGRIQNVLYFSNIHFMKWFNNSKILKKLNPKYNPISPPVLPMNEISDILTSLTKLFNTLT